MNYRAALPIRPGTLRWLLVPALVAIAVCDGDPLREPDLDSIGETAEHAEALDRNRSRWEARGPRSYEYVLERLCFCPPESRGPYLVRVEDGEVAAVLDPATGEPVDPEDDRWIVSLDGLFDVIVDALERDAHELRVEYDPELGFPAEIFIDYRKQVIDEEVGFEARDLTPLP